MGLIYLILVPVLYLSLWWSALRPARNGRLGLGMGLAGRAWLVLFLRAPVGIHNGDVNAWGVSSVLIVTVLVALVIRFVKQKEMKRLPPPRRLKLHFGVWAGMVLGISLLILLTLLSGAYVVQTAVLLFLGTLFAVYEPKGSGA